MSSVFIWTDQFVLKKNIRLVFDYLRMSINYRPSRAA